MKKVVSLVISLLLIFGIVPISASAETTSITQDGITYEIDTTTGEAEVYDADAGIVTADIPSEINGCPVTSIGDYAFGYYFDDSGYIHKIENFTIYGYTGSAAETYANENDFTFISIGDMPETPTTQGDLNGDNIISIVDARLALVAVVSGNASDEDTAIADFNGDGKLSIVDVRLLLVKIANGEV